MIWRLMIVCGLMFPLAACVHDERPMALGLPHTMGLELKVGNPALPTAADEQALAEPNMASKVLAAIALQRVTGITPDPAVFGRGF